MRGMHTLSLNAFDLNNSDAALMFASSSVVGAFQVELAPLGFEGAEVSAS